MGGSVAAATTNAPMAAMLAQRPSTMVQYRSRDSIGRPSARPLRLREAAIEWLARVCDGGAFSPAARAGALPFPLRPALRFPIPPPPAVRDPEASVRTAI